MNKDTIHNKQQSVPSNEYYNEEIDLVEYIRVIWKYRTFIAIIVGTTFVISTIVSFLLPKQYMATALISAGTIGGDEAGKYVSMLKGMSGGFFNIGAASTSNMQVLGLLKSRSLADHLITKFDLMKEFKIKKRDAARSIISNLLQGSETKEDLIQISVEYKNPQKAALFINEAVNYIDQMINNLNIFGVSKQRIFLENRLMEIKESLDLSENKLKEFQEKHRLLDIETQTSIAVNTLSIINTQIIEAETEFGIKTQLRSPYDPELLNLQAKIVELKKQQAKMIRKSSKVEPRLESNSDYLIALDQTPEIGLDFLRLKRELKTHESLFELLTEQYELAKIDETKNLPKISIIDRASVPELKTKPNKKLIVVVSTTLAILFSIVIVFILEYLTKKKILQ